jgi:hypothetical protein
MLHLPAFPGVPDSPIFEIQVLHGVLPFFTLFALSHLPFNAFLVLVQPSSQTAQSDISRVGQMFFFGALPSLHAQSKVFVNLFLLFAAPTFKFLTDTVLL